MNNACTEDLADTAPAASTSGELNDAICRAPYLLVLERTIKRNRARCLPAAYPTAHRRRHLTLNT